MLERFTIHNLRELVTHSGVAFTATIALDNKPIARVENKGDGGCNTYFGMGGTAAETRANMVTIRELERVASDAIGRKYEALDFLICFMTPGVTGQQAVAAAKKAL